MNSEYQKALNSAKYKTNLKYDKTLLSKRNKKQRKIDIMSINQPLSLNVNSKIEKQFLSLITTSSNINHPYENIQPQHNQKIIQLHKQF